MDMLQGSIIGKTPLLMHNPAVMQSAGGSIGRKTIPTPEDEADASTYKLPDGSLCVPAVAIRNCVLSGLTGVRFNRRAASPVLAGALLPSDLYFPLYDDQGNPITAWAIDTQRAVVQRQGIMRSRARVDPPWTVAFSFNLNTQIANPEAVLAMVSDALNTAGSSIGILDYRPQKKGWYGTFALGELRVISV
jgi:hypothetical protein